MRGTVSSKLQNWVWLWSFGLGTKKLIEDYTQEIVTQLEYIGEKDFIGCSKLEFFNDTRQSFGSTALVLYGGATFGSYHLGVVKALNKHGLLPRIISGTAIGALIAALVCIRTDEDLPSIFEEGGVDLGAFSKKGSKGNIKRKISRFLKHGKEKEKKWEIIFGKEIYNC